MAGCRNLSDEEIKLIKEKCTRQRDRTLVELGYRTGFRISELLSIKIENVWQFGRVVDTLRIEKEFVKGKKQAQEIPLHKDAKREIELLLQEFDSYNPEYFLFKSTVSQTQKNPNKAISRNQAHHILKLIVKELELQGKIATHSLKKSFAWKFYKKSGNDLRATQVALRHKFMDTTIKYLDPDKKSVDSMILDL